MQHANIITLFVLLLNCLCILSVGWYSANSAEFCYEDPSCGPNSDAWGGQCKTGSKQSPIDLPFAFDRIAKSVQLDFNEYYYNDGKF